MCLLGFFWAFNSKSRVSAKKKISRVKIFEKKLQNLENFENLKIDLAKKIWKNYFFGKPWMYYFLILIILLCVNFQPSCYFLRWFPRNRPFLRFSLVFLTQKSPFSKNCQESGLYDLLEVVCTGGLGGLRIEWHQNQPSTQFLRSSTENWGVRFWSQKSKNFPKNGKKCHFRSFWPKIRHF